MAENIIAINYADDNFTDAQKLNTWTAKHLGRASRVIEYGPKDMDEVFWESNKDILSRSRGGGYWLWKPYFIARTLRLLQEGDYLVYCDAGIYYNGAAG